MKISKKDLRRIIFESLLEEKREKNARVARRGQEGGKGRRGKMGRRVDDSDETVDGDMPRPPATAAGSGSNPAAAVATAPTSGAEKKAKAKPKSNPKTAYIQKVIGAPSAKGKDQGDGQWGTNTTDAWKEWVVTDDTIKKIEMLKAKKESQGEAAVDENKKFNLSFLFKEDKSSSSKTSEDSEIAKFVRKNKGNAAAIAKKLGYSPNLSGVEKLVRDLETQSTSASSASAEEKAEGWEKRQGYFNSFKKTYKKENKYYLDIAATNWNDTREKVFGNIKPMGRSEVIFAIPSDQQAQFGELSFVMKFSNTYSEDVDAIEVMVKNIKGAERSVGENKNFKLRELKASGDEKRIELENIPAAKQGYSYWVTGKELYLIALQALGRMKKYFKEEGSELVVKDLYADIEEMPESLKREEEKTEQLRSLGMVAENNNTLGESHGSLIRKRYWGRY